jgi:hypothetical protein
VTDAPISYRVATFAEIASAEENSPRLRAGFEALGFVRLGGMMRVTADPAFVEKLAAEYEPPAAALFRIHAEKPDTLLGAPDRSAFVRIGWFWGSPSVHLLSLLDDGRLVETRAAWTVDPPWPMYMQAYYRRTDRRREQLLDAVPGRSIRLVDSDDPAALWSAHRRHVEAELAFRAAGVAPHESSEQMCALETVAFAVAWRSANRVRRATHAAVALCLLVVLAASFVASRLIDTPRTAVLVTFGLAVVAWVVALRLPWVLRHARWLRPEFRAAASAVGR